VNDIAPAEWDAYRERSKELAQAGEKLRVRVQCEACAGDAACVDCQELSQSYAEVLLGRKPRNVWRAEEQGVMA
jgi:hypothetical protein